MAQLGVAGLMFAHSRPIVAKHSLMIQVDTLSFSNMNVKMELLMKLSRSIIMKRKEIQLYAGKKLLSAMICQMNAKLMTIAPT